MFLDSENWELGCLYSENLYLRTGLFPNESERQRRENTVENQVTGPMSLLWPLRYLFGVNQRVENGQHMAPVTHNARQDIPQFRLAFRFAVPLG